MRLLPALALVAATTVARADEPHPSPTIFAHVRISDVGEYGATVARSGTPTSLWVRTAGDSIEIRLRLDAPGRMRYEVKRAGARQFMLEGECAPPFGRPYTVGHFPINADGENRMVDVQLWLSNP